jgi:hypothetical protein
MRRLENPIEVQWQKPAPMPWLDLVWEHDRWPMLCERNCTLRPLVGF